MRTANLTAGLMNLGGLLACLVGLSAGLTQIVADHFGQPAGAVYAAGLAFAAVANGLLAGSFLAPAVLGRDDEQGL